MGLSDVAIVGVYATEQGRQLPERTALDLAQEAVFGAIADAGLTLADVDGVAADWAGPGGPSRRTRVMGQGARAPAVVDHDGTLDAAGSRGILKAAAAIDAGLCDVAVVGGGLAGDIRRRRFGRPSTDTPVSSPIVWGSYGGGPVRPSLPTSHMHEFGTQRQRQVALAAATIRNNGHVNPEAVMYGMGPYTVDDVLASPMIASPLHRLEICLTGEGVRPVVLTSVERAREPPSSGDSRPSAGDGLRWGAVRTFPRRPVPSEVGRLGAAAATRAFAMAGIGRHRRRCVQHVRPELLRVSSDRSKSSGCATRGRGASSSRPA